MRVCTSDGVGRRCALLGGLEQSHQTNHYGFPHFLIGCEVSQQQAGWTKEGRGGRGGREGREGERGGEDGEWEMKERMGERDEMKGWRCKMRKISREAVRRERVRGGLSLMTEKKGVFHIPSCSTST